ncbi:putative cardiolipin synthase [Pseudomonas taetrolens]|uniref:Cardiolipin synthase B n=1 Tax=Pseudomonas taetrolens TaxID=47884 RepID=A0A0J6GL26_PSETA|nr:cardiolipin synthase ClsB [Pseudomonas taetrolens]KMM85376.1 cardiolipin synthase 2 [Pseudomonas taetrolens]SEC33249.1 putative cardiolipin synthase [Pseudomonas taetrolens]SQF86369.1 cardiolipin synthase 2 [Pseudomonas taetrolens]VEH49446.1 cardiolipin synthase 2 [Pseudomonas taetrolens]
MNYPWRDGNRVNLLINGEDYYPRVFKAVRAARREILIETFIIFEDKVGRAFKNVLVAAARRGVHIELTVDGYGTAELSPRYIGELTEAGINIHVFDPARRVFGLRSNLFRRMHRKILLIDGECAFIGGINYSADHLGDYGPMAKQDYALEVQGPVVADIHRDVLRMLKPVIKAPSDVCPGRCRVGDARLLLSIRDNADHSTDIEEQYLLAIRAAVHRLVIANAYFFPGYRLLRELRNASRRGVEVTLILQGEPDMPWVRSASRLLYNYLLRDGVRIFEYCQRPFHGKVALMDHEWSTVGSSNLDPLSLALNLEANLFIRDRALNRQLHDHLLGLATEHCTRITLARVTRGYWWRAPLIFIGFHLTRRFPAIAGLLPAHTPRLRSLRTLDDGELSYDQENTP